ncbi:MAG TPA: glycosyltransferase [Firmicutes bacterium]|jgi:N-acetylglucosaminyldiphosphoundecaprenol N-acetyl-beta-D-mannosaminyltransferase|nr:glycosyltransferase [Bacillota bacterium]
MDKQINFIQSDSKLNGFFVRRVDKSTIPTCNILGVNIAAINMEWLLNYLRKYLKSPKGNLLAGDYICVSNVHTTVTSYEDAEYCKIQNGGLMAIPDGGPLSTVGKKCGFQEMERTTGPGLMGELFKISTELKYRHYFYGSTEDTLKKIYQMLKKNYPGIQIAGMYNPPFHPVTEEEDATIIKMINYSNPEIVWVGLGAPKQEKWMAEHQGKVNGLMVGVGAGFDYFAGNMNRAPVWMQKSNLEWFYRLIQDPKRLFQRYLHTNLKFLWLEMFRGQYNVLYLLLREAYKTIIRIN